MQTQLTTPTADHQIYGVLHSSAAPDLLFMRNSPSIYFLQCSIIRLDVWWWQRRGWLAAAPRRAPDLVQPGSHQRALSLNCATKTAPPANSSTQACKPKSPYSTPAPPRAPPSTLPVTAPHRWFYPEQQHHVVAGDVSWCAGGAPLALLGARATAREGLCFEPSYETGRGVDSQPNLQCASRNSIMMMMMTRMTKMI